MTAEKRSYPRINVSHSVLYSKDIYPKQTIASTVNLSMGGTQIESFYSLNKDEALQIAIHIDLRIIKCRGKVIHVLRLENDKVRAGIRFEALPEDEKFYLRQYLSHGTEKPA